MSIDAVLKNELPWHIEVCDVLDGLRMLPDACVQCIVTSPPYWGLRDYQVAGQLGCEKTPQEYVANLVAIFRECRRVLRDDGTLFLNLGDTYCNFRSTGYPGQSVHGGAQRGKDASRQRGAEGLKEKDLVGIPWRVAFALQDGGWYLRQDMIWSKPNPMPESVGDRCTKSHEYIFLLTKSQRYFFDAEAIKEPCVDDKEASRKKKGRFGGANKHAGYGTRIHSGREYHGTSDGRRNKRSVWNISLRSYKGAHFATFPPELPRLCLSAGTSLAGCCKECGTPLARIVEKKRKATRPGADTKITGDSRVDGNRDPERHVTETKTVGWQPQCKCSAEPIPCLALDIFNGAGTTGVVAKRLGLRYIGFELNPDYAAMARERIELDQGEKKKPKKRVPKEEQQPSLFGAFQC